MIVQLFPILHSLIAFTFVIHLFTHLDFLFNLWKLTDCMVIL